jgi:DNA-binding GntR family transcriptional regulator
MVGTTATADLIEANDSEARESGDGTLASMAVHAIINLIRSGELKPGDIVNETDMAKRFGMSRGPIREAVRRLEGRKLIIREAYLRARVVPMDRPRIVELYELRESLEGMACRLATRRMSDAALGRLVADVEQSTKSPALAPYFTQSYALNFHRAVLDGCGNSRIRDTLCLEIYDLVRLHRWSAGAVPGRGGQARHEHWQICRAMATRDEQLAESLMRSHINRAMQLDKP